MKKIFFNFIHLRSRVMWPVGVRKGDMTHHQLLPSNLWTPVYFSCMYLFLLADGDSLDAASGFEVLDMLLIFSVVFWYVEHLKSVK